MRPELEVADIFRRHGDAFRAAQGDRLSRAQRRVMAAIEACRTATLGGHVERCEDCGKVRVAYNSCRNRHCPKCQGLARAQWLADRRADLLPVPYFHVVFTVPTPIAAIALQNKAVVYDILFKAAADTIRTIASDPKHLGAETGMIAILHTWGQTLTHHPPASPPPVVTNPGSIAPTRSWPSITAPRCHASEEATRQGQGWKVAVQISEEEADRPSSVWPRSFLRLTWRWQAWRYCETRSSGRQKRPRPRAAGGRVCAPLFHGARRARDLSSYSRRRHARECLKPLANDPEFSCRCGAARARLGDGGLALSPSRSPRAAC